MHQTCFNVCTYTGCPRDTTTYLKTKGFQFLETYVKKSDEFTCCFLKNQDYFSEGIFSHIAYSDMGMAIVDQ